MSTTLENADILAADRDDPRLAKALDARREEAAREARAAELAASVNAARQALPRLQAERQALGSATLAADERTTAKVAAGERDLDAAQAALAAAEKEAAPLRAKLAALLDGPTADVARARAALDAAQRAENISLEQARQSHVTMLRANEQVIADAERLLERNPPQSLVEFRRWLDARAAEISDVPHKANWARPHCWPNATECQMGGGVDSYDVCDRLTRLEREASKVAYGTVSAARRAIESRRLWLLADGDEALAAGIAEIKESVDVRWQHPGNYLNYQVVTGDNLVTPGGRRIFLRHYLLTGEIESHAEAVARTERQDKERLEKRRVESVRLV